MKLFDKIFIALSNTNVSFHVSKVKWSGTLWYRSIEGPNSYCTIAEMDDNLVALYDRDGCMGNWNENQLSDAVVTFLKECGVRK